MVFLCFSNYEVVAVGKQFAVLGLGRFGGSLVKEFAEIGIEVLAVDTDVAKVQHYAKYATHAVLANPMDEGSMRGLGLSNMDHVFISFGDDIQASVLTALLLKELGVPQVWAKAHDDHHAKVLEKIGVDRVIHPEKDMAKRIAHHITSKKMVDFIELSKELSIAEVVASEKIANKTLKELNTRGRYGCIIVAIHRGEETLVAMPDDRILEGDILILIGRNEDIDRFDRRGV